MSTTEPSRTRRAARIAATSLACLALAGSCGGAEEAPPLEFAFRMHALDCGASVPLQARLEVSGVEGVCPLDVRADRTVLGVCRGIPTGELRDFRLVYYYFDAALQDEVQLAAVTARVDLRDARERQLRLEFPADRMDTSADDDGDCRSNLFEYCSGRSPRSSDCATDPQQPCCR
jgi:hypothetical protein